MGIHSVTFSEWCQIDNSDFSLDENVFCVKNPGTPFKNVQACQPSCATAKH